LLGGRESLISIIESVSKVLIDMMTDRVKLNGRTPTLVLHIRHLSALVGKSFCLILDVKEVEVQIDLLSLITFLILLTFMF
jgi:hypothetical protein